MQYNFMPNYPQNMMMPRTQMPVTLYVGNLDEAVKEEQLFSHFTKYGPLHSIKVVKDKNTMKSRGFGYVNFMHLKDAETARMIAQYDFIGRKPIRILHKGNPKEKTESNLFVRNIDSSVSFKELHNHFSTAGAVLSVKIAYDSVGKSLGYGYVQFEKPEDATKAIGELNGSKLKERDLAVEKFQPRTGRKVGSTNNLYVKHLPEGKTKEEIEALLDNTFEPFGRISSRLAVTKDSKVWSAFICYESSEEAGKAYSQLNNALILEGASQPLYVNFHTNRKERALERKKHVPEIKNTNIFMKNLKPEVTDAQITELFKTFGEITSCALKEADFRGQKFKMGFVNFRTQEEAVKAQSESLHNEEIKKLFYNNIPYIGLWLPKEQRQQFKETKSNRFLNPHLMKDFAQGPMYPQQFSNYVQQPQAFGMMPQQQFQPTPVYPQPRNENYAMNPHLNPNMQQQAQQQHQQQHQQQPPQFQPRGPSAGGQFNRRQNNFIQGNRAPYQRNPGQHQQHRMGGPGGQNQGQSYNRPQNQNRRPLGNQQGPQMNEDTGVNQRRNEPENNQKGAEAPGAQLTVQNLKDKLQDFLRLESEKQRNILGELLYPKILGMAGPTFAPKITGMLVDFDVLTIQDILELLEDPVTLGERIKEAQELIEQEGSE